MKPPKVYELTIPRSHKTTSTVRIVPSMLHLPFRLRPPRSLLETGGTLLIPCRDSCVSSVLLTGLVKSAHTIIKEWNQSMNAVNVVAVSRGHDAAPATTSCGRGL